MADEDPEKSSLSLEVEGNRLAFIPAGPDRLDALIALVHGAQRSLRILFYIFKEDDSGRRVRDALLAACSRGVKVSLLVDGFGSEFVRGAFFQPLIDSGCRFCRFEPRWGRRYLLRNHQKLALADDQRVLAGGFNVADDYFGTADQKAWRDLGVQLDGPAAAPLGAYFDDIFAWSQRKRSSMRELRRILERHSQHEGRLRWLFGGPVPRLSPWARTLRMDMVQASRLDLIAAYFAPNRAMLRRICDTALHGGVRIVTAAKSDNGATIGAARHTYWRLLRRGVKIFEYQPTKLHTKLIIVDDKVHVGSGNFDVRSLYLNVEMMLRIEDAALAASLRGFVEGEIAQSEEVSLAFHKARRTWFNRLKWALCYFIVATMDYNVTRRLNFGVARA
ncbi:MAG TPA: phosphatidylserine/phosphatidylglycerophosphate/cardiolipin synthase family protein [Allosphingosinicella sp.]|nr:phosphatidylserine/phosphatidylglycerophosphate/cardiolipin synthase family protein [Allosphingosinicella sp.]